MDFHRTSTFCIKNVLSCVGCFVGNAHGPGWILDSGETSGVFIETGLEQFFLQPSTFQRFRAHPP